MSQTGDGRHFLKVESQGIRSFFRLRLSSRLLLFFPHFGDRDGAGFCGKRVLCEPGGVLETLLRKPLLLPTEQSLTKVFGIDPQVLANTHKGENFVIPIVQDPILSFAENISSFLVASGDMLLKGGYRIFENGEHEAQFRMKLDSPPNGLVIFPYWVHGVKEDFVPRGTDTTDTDVSLVGEMLPALFVHLLLLGAQKPAVHSFSLMLEQCAGARVMPGSFPGRWQFRDQKNSCGDSGFREIHAGNSPG